MFISSPGPSAIYQAFTGCAQSRVIAEGATKAGCVQEHRLHPRKEVSIETRLFLPCISRHEAAIIIPCRIVDVSKGGVRVLVKASYRLPLRVFLLRGEDENSYECRIVWQDGQLAGLQFAALCSNARHQELLREMKTAQIADAEPNDDFSVTS
jgi:hypothetical protein